MTKRMATMRLFLRKQKVEIFSDYFNYPHPERNDSILEVKFCKKGKWYIANECTGYNTRLEAVYHYVMRETAMYLLINEFSDLYSKWLEQHEDESEFVNNRAANESIVRLVNESNFIQARLLPVKGATFADFARYEGMPLMIPEVEMDEDVEALLITNKFTLSSVNYKECIEHDVTMYGNSDYDFFIITLKNLPE